jgi:hypothetical protein
MKTPHTRKSWTIGAFERFCTNLWVYVISFRVGALSSIHGPVPERPALCPGDIEGEGEMYSSLSGNEVPTLKIDRKLDWFLLVVCFVGLLLVSSVGSHSGYSSPMKEPPTVLIKK